MGQSPPDESLVRDSLYRQVLSEGFLRQAYYLPYSQGSFSIETESGVNPSLSGLDDFIRLATSQLNLRVTRIRLTGYSSIEGDYRTNEVISRERVRAFYQYLRETYPTLYRFPHDLAWVAEDWNELSRLVRRSQIAEREEILEIIRKVPSFDERETLLTYLNGGRAYSALEQSVFPKLRRVEIQVEYASLTPALSKREGEAALSALSDPAPSAPLGHLPLAGEELAGADRWLAAQSVSSSSLSLGEGRGEAVSIEEWLGIRNKRKTDNNNKNTHKHDRALAASSSFSFVEGGGKGAGSAASFRPSRSVESFDAVGSSPRFTFKTNLLLWAGILPDFKHTTPMLNGGLEYAFTNSFSLHIDAMYSYWHYDDQAFQGISGYSVEPRFTPSLSIDRLGIFLGPYVHFGDYDLRTIKKDAAGNPDEENLTGKYWDAGLSAGLKFRLLGPLGLEVGARAGYVSSKVYSYTRDNQNNWYAGDRKYHKWKLTGLTLALTLAIEN